MATAWLILLAILALVIGGYMLAWRSKRSPIRKSGSWAVAVVAAVAGLIGTVGYAIPAFDDFHNPAVSFRAALIGNILIWAICLGAWTVAMRFAVRALRRRQP